MADMCRRCGTTPNPGETMCATDDEMARCPWMDGVVRNVIVKPMSRIETPDGPLYTTDVDGVVVHGDVPITLEGKRAISALLEAARRHLAKSDN